MTRSSSSPVPLRSLPVGAIVRLALMLAASAGLSMWSATPARAGSVTSLFSFSGPPNGLLPSAGPVRGRDGNFYGTVTSGGLRNNGTVYRITPAGVLTTLYHFSGLEDGGSPIGGLVLGNDGNFYGTTSSGGTAGDGTVFRITPAGTLTTLYSFTGGDDGALPQAALAQGTDGNFYGTTRGVDLVHGTVFRIAPTGALTTLYAFQYGFGVGTDGYNVPGALVQGSDGNFYGAASAGGTLDGGTVFRVTPAGELTTLYNFTGGTDGSLPVGGLALGPDGNLYGTTSNNGDASANQGTVFRITPAGVLTTIHRFLYSGDGGIPTTGLLSGSDGNLYGATSQGGADNLPGGTIFQVTPAGGLQTLYSFGGGLDGSRPGLSLARDSDGSLYGVTTQDGAGNNGTVFRVTAGGVHTTLFAFGRTPAPFQPTTALTKAGDGNFYGTTQIGGLYNNGTVYRVTPAGALTTLHNFTGAEDGGNPAAPLTLGNDGNLYGTANGGTTGEGLAFRITLDGMLTVIHAFSGGAADGGIPVDAPLAKGSDGNFYGATVAYPDPDGFDVLPGSIYQMTPSGAVTTLYVFTTVGVDGRVVGLVQGRDGNLYCTSEGGANGAGRVLRLTPAGALTVLYNFDGGAHGGNPAGGLILGRDGNFYGTTQAGGASGGGTVYSITPTGALTTLASFADGADGSLPYASLAQGGDGNFYGTTLLGGAGGYGTVFRVTRAGVLKTLYSFTNGTDGSYPYAGLAQGGDGNFYGTTFAGGGYGQGGIFRLRVIQLSSAPTLK